jgi:hypothetical protein
MTSLRHVAIEAENLPAAVKQKSTPAHGGTPINEEQGERMAGNAGNSPTSPVWKSGLGPQRAIQDFSIEPYISITYLMFGAL